MPVESIVAGFRPWAELLGFVKDVVLAGAVIYGVRQVSLAKQSLDVAQKQREEDQQRAIAQHERAAKTVTLDYAYRFADQFGRKYLAYVEVAAAYGLQPYAGPVGDFKLASLTPQAQQVALRRNQLPACGAALDELEVFAAAHTTGVADEEFGFKLNGRMFCSIVSQDYYDVLCFEREQGYYQSIVDLFDVWSPRLKRDRLSKSRELIELQRVDIELRKAELEKQMEKLPEGPKVPPIGARRS